MDYDDDEILDATRHSYINDESTEN